MRHVAHDGGAVDGPVVGVHGGHLGHLLALHRDAGRGGRLRQAQATGGLLAMDLRR